MDNSCVDQQCKYYTEKFVAKDGIWDYESFCTKQDKFIDYENEVCSDYQQSQKCFNCKHRRTIVYETGTIDSIDYHCTLQEDKFIHSDLSWCQDNYADFPDCNIKQWVYKSWGI